MKTTDEEEAKKVDVLYSTKPKREILGEREYRIPANYFGPKERDEPDTFVAQENGFGFFLFLPDYGGYTKENWRDRFDRRLIKVLQVKTVDKNEIISLTDGTRRRIRPESYGEPSAGFRIQKSLLEEKPSIKKYGIEGYRYKGRGTDEIVWTGIRSNGEFFFFHSTDAPEEPSKPGIRYPHCQTQYYSEKNDLFIAYRYALEHIAKWQKIDDAIWAKLGSWRVK